MRNVHCVAYSRAAIYLESNIHYEEGRWLKEDLIMAEALGGSAWAQTQVQTGSHALNSALRQHLSGASAQI